MALALYLDSGIRIDEHWLPEALWASGLSAVRIALPARTYLDEQVAWIASRIIAVHERRREVLGLFRLPTGTGLSRSLRARFRRARGTP